MTKRVTTEEGDVTVEAVIMQLEICIYDPAVGTDIISISTNMN